MVIPKFYLLFVNTEPRKTVHGTAGVYRVHIWDITPNDGVKKSKPQNQDYTSGGCMASSFLIWSMESNMPAMSGYVVA